MNDSNYPPRDWSDKEGWNRYFSAELSQSPASGYPDMIVRRFLKFARLKGGGIWFPGCGLDPYPYTYAKQGCKVLGTDFSAVALRFQRHVAEVFQKEKESDQNQGELTIAEHDFVHDAAGGPFDLVINCRAFQGLSPDAMQAAARNFHTALRPGGALILDTMNVQGTHRREVMEDSLQVAGFYLPCQKTERWYRRQLDGTGIVYGMLLGRPRIPNAGQYPPESFSQLAERDQKILDSFEDEYKRRREAEAAEVQAMSDDPAVKVAHIVYATG